MATFATSGQVCMAVKRLYVHASRADEVVEAYVAAADRVLRLGDPLRAGATIGPVVTAEAAAGSPAWCGTPAAEAPGCSSSGTVDDGTDLDARALPAPDARARRRRRRPAGRRPSSSGPTVPLLTYDDVEEAVAPRQRRRARPRRLGVVAPTRTAPSRSRARLDAGFTFVNTHNRTGLSLRASRSAG